MKKERKEWVCNNTCGFNCCSEIFLPVTPIQRMFINKKGYFVVEEDYTDFKWLGYHDAFDIKELDEGKKKIIVKTKDYKYYWNPYVKKHMIYIKNKCNKILDDNKCSIFEDRPVICMKAECPVFSEKKKIRWYGKKGLLKEKVEAYKKGELKKWH